MFAPADLFVINDTLDALLLGSFFFGLVFVVISLAIGFADLGLGHDGGVDANGHIGDTGHHVGSLSQINIGTVLAFLTWFGGVTYLLRNSAGLNLFLSLIVGIGAGIVCAALILRFMRLLKSDDIFLSAAEDRIGGTIGRVSSPVRADGTGEITYIANGVRQVSAARSGTGLALPRGAEVVVLRRERGIAIVEPWLDETDPASWEQRFAADANENRPALPHPEC